MVYTANYAPVAGDVGASAGVVLIPIVLLFVLIFTTRVIYAAAAALLVFLVIAAHAYGMPWPMALLAACNGFLYVRWRPAVPERRQGVWPRAAPHFSLAATLDSPRH